jgi:homoserine kinase type II
MMNDIADIAELIKPYPVGKVLSFEHIKKGYMNHSFIVRTDKGKYILRIGKKTKTANDLLFEIKMLNHLRGLPTPKYVQDNTGNYVNVFKGHNYTVYQYIEGSTPKKTSEKLMQQVAFFLAEFHNQTKNFKSDSDRFAWYTFSGDRAAEFKNYLMKALPNYKNDIIYMEKEVLNTRLPDSLPTGPLHCDVKRENVLVINDRLTGVVDFDNCQMGPYLLDLAISINWFCTDWNGLDYHKTYRFIAYYEKRRRLSKFERKLLFRAIKYAYISHEFVDYYVYAKQIITEDYFNFGRRFFLPAAKTMNEQKFNRIVSSRFAFIFNLS